MGMDAEGRGLHRAPLRRLDPRLPALLHHRRQGLPAEGARAAARVAPVEGPRDRATCCRSRQGEQVQRRDRDARLQGGRVPRPRDEARGSSRRPRFEEYNTPLKADGIIAIKLRDDDALVGVLHSSTASDDIILVSRKGQAIRFHESDVRSMGRATSGVQGMRPRARRRGDLGRDRRRRARHARGDRRRATASAHAISRLPGQGPRRARRQDRAADRGARTARRRDASVRDGYQVMLISNGGTVIRMPVDGDQAARPLDAGRDRDAAPRGRAGLEHRARGRGG